MELTDIEKNKLERFWLDEIMREAVRKFILSNSGDMPINALAINKSNLEIGENVRAVKVYLQEFEKSFGLIANFIRQEKKKPEENPAI